MNTAHQSLLARATMFSSLVADHECDESTDFFGEQPVGLPSGAFLIGWAGVEFNLCQELRDLAGLMNLEISERPEFEDASSYSLYVEDAVSEESIAPTDRFRTEQPSSKERAWALKTVLRDNRQEDLKYRTSEKDIVALCGTLGKPLARPLARQSRKTRRVPIVERINLQLK